MSLDALLQALSDGELQRRFDAQVLERGRALAARIGALQLTQDGAQQACSAAVPGSAAPYAVRLWQAPGTELRGQCPCAFARAGAACKHQAALALAWRAQRAGELLQEAVPAAPAAPNAPTAPDWPAFLRDQSAARLAAFVVAQAQALPALEQAVRQWQRASLPVDDLASARKAVSAVLAAPRDLYEWRRVGAYARKAEGVLSLLAGWTVQRPEIALGAADWALTRLRRVWAQADDSGGHIGALMRELAAAHLRALQAAGPQDAAFGKRLDELLGADDHALFDLPALLQAAGPEAARRYGERVAAAWARDAQGADHAREASKQRLLAFHRAQGDGPAALDLLREALRDAGDHIDLVQELQRQGRSREALAAVEAACRRWPQQPRLRELRLQAYEADGWDAEALAQREEDFVRAPSLSAYLGCLRAAVQAGQPEAAARERLWALLDAQGRGGDARTAGWLGGIKLALWQHEGRWAEALDHLSSGGRCDDAALQAFALALPPSHHGVAVELLKPLLPRLLARSVSPYAEALHLVGEMVQRMAPGARTLYLAWLKLEFRAKKRFVDGLAAQGG